MSAKTFGEADGCTSWPHEREDDLVLFLTVPLHDEREMAQALSQADEDKNGNSEEWSEED